MADDLLKLHIEQDKEQFRSINSKLDQLIETQLRQRGFVAGFSAACSLLVSLLLGLVVYIWNHR